MKLIVIGACGLALAALLAGCATPAAQMVATDVQTIEKPVAVPCKFKWPDKPVPHVALVQLTGNPMVDLVLIWRAAEAELGERIAYETLFEAAAKACVKPP